MKHIFTIHSHITFLSALATVEYNQLDKNDVIFICNKYNPPIKQESKIELVKSFDEVESNYSIWQRLTNFNYGNGCDKFISNLIKKIDYVAYIDLMSMFNRFLVTNKQCKQFHFIEEGSANYADFDSFRMLTADLDMFHWRVSYNKHLKEILLSVYRMLRGRSLRILNLPIQPNIYAFFKEVNFYGFSEYSFPNIPKNKKIIITFSSIKSELNQKSELDENLNNSFIWVGDAGYNLYGISKDHFRNALSKLLLEIDKSKSNKVYIKYRGLETEEERKIIESVFKKYNFTIHFIPEDAVVEYIFMNYKNLTVLGNSSSLLIYAKILGHDVYSIFPYIPNVYNMHFATNFDKIHKLLNLKE